MIPPCSVLLCLVVSSALLVYGFPVEEGAIMEMNQNDGQPAPPQTLLCTLATPGNTPGRKRSEEGPVIQMKPSLFQQGASSSVYTCKPTGNTPRPAEPVAPGRPAEPDHRSRFHNSDNEN